MCNVCIALSAIEHGRRNPRWGTGERLWGLQLTWNDGPRVNYRRVPPKPIGPRRPRSRYWSQHRLHFVHPSRPTVYVIAEGKAEGPGRYKMRRLGERYFPRKWTEVPNLADEFSALDLGMKWSSVNPAMREYLRGRSKSVPTWDEIDASVSRRMRRDRAARRLKLRRAWVRRKQARDKP